MKRILSSFSICCLWSTFAFASIQNGIDKLINQVDPAINIGVEVIDLTTGQSIYTRNPNRAFIPASNMKLFSDAAALILLGPDYRFNNQLSTDASQLRKTVLKGNVYLHLPGDPSFSQQQLNGLLSSLKDLGIQQIDGNLIIDSSHKDVRPYAPGWMVEDLAHGYGAPIAPLIIDTNRLTVTVNPASSPKQKAIVETTDTSNSIKINNFVKTKTRGKRCGIDFKMNRKNQLTVSGCVAQGQWAVQQRLAIRNPLSYAKGLIRTQLAQLNIQLQGKVELGKAPKSTLLLASSKSKPISQLIADTLKPSDNLYAESLYLHAAAKLKGVPVNWGEAQKLIKAFLEQQTGISLKSAILTDGSGLSRYDLLTPRQTVKLLQYLHDHFHFSYEFISALPVSGRDGTLQRRFNKPSQQDFVRAKTGTMRGVISLSGYLYTLNGHTLSFAIYINNLPTTRPSVSGRYRYLVDALCTYLLKQRPEAHQIAKIPSPHQRIAFQKKLTQASLLRQKEMKWRRLEQSIKTSLVNQSVSVIYRRKEMVLYDNENDPNVVWNALKNLAKKQAFSVALNSTSFPKLTNGQLSILWIQENPNDPNSKRRWIIKETPSQG